MPFDPESSTIEQVVSAVTPEQPLSTDRRSRERGERSVKKDDHLHPVVKDLYGVLPRIEKMGSLSAPIVRLTSETNQEWKELRDTLASDSRASFVVDSSNKSLEEQQKQISLEAKTLLHIEGENADSLLDLMLAIKEQFSDPNVDPAKLEESLINFHILYSTFNKKYQELVRVQHDDEVIHGQVITKALHGVGFKSTEEIIQKTESIAQTINTYKKEWFGFKTLLPEQRRQIRELELEQQKLLPVLRIARSTPPLKYMGTEKLDDTWGVALNFSKEVVSGISEKYQKLLSTYPPSKSYNTDDATITNDDFIRDAPFFIISDSYQKFLQQTIDGIRSKLGSFQFRELKDNLSNKKWSVGRNAGPDAFKKFLNFVSSKGWEGAKARAITEHGQSYVDIAENFLITSLRAATLAEPGYRCKQHIDDDIDLKDHENLPLQLIYGASNDIKHIVFNLQRVNNIETLSSLVQGGSPEIQRVLQLIDQNPETFDLTTVENPQRVEFRKKLFNDLEFVKEFMQGMWGGRLKTNTVRLAQTPEEESWGMGYAGDDTQQFDVLCVSKEIAQKEFPELLGAQPVTLSPEYLARAQLLFARQVLQHKPYTKFFLNQENDWSDYHDEGPGKVKLQLPEEVFNRYCLKFNIDYENATKFVDNPVSLQIRENLRSICVEYLRKDPKTAGFLAGFYTFWRTPMDEEYALFESAIAQAPSEAARDEIIHCFVERLKSGDRRSMDSIFATYSGASEDNQIKMRIAVHDQLKMLALEDAPIDLIAKIAQMFSETPDDVTGMFAFIRKLQGANFPCDTSIYTGNNIKSFIKASQCVGLIAFLVELRDHSFDTQTIRYDQAPVLLEHREEILSSLTTVHQLFPDFVYSPNRDRGFLEYNPYQLLLYGMPRSTLIARLSQALQERREVSPEYGKSLSSILVSASNWQTNIQKENASDPTKPSFSKGLEVFLKTPIAAEQAGSWYANDAVLRLVHAHPERASVLRDFPLQAPLLMRPEYKATLEFVIEHGGASLTSKRDIQFINGLVGKFSKASHEIIAGYIACVESGVITSSDQQIIEEMLEQFRVVQPSIVKGYKQARSEGKIDQFLAYLRSIMERATGKAPLSKTERSSPYYEDLMKEVYSNNSGQWGSYAGTKFCEDRPQDLEHFALRPQYSIDLLAAGTITLKDGTKLDEVGRQKIEQNVYDVNQLFAKYDFDPEKVKEECNRRIDVLFEGLKQAGKFVDNDSSALSSEERLLLVVGESLYNQSVPTDELKALLTLYQFAYYEDVRGYITGTSDRVRNAPNKDYALLCELHTLFSDRIKEVYKQLIGKAWDHPVVGHAMKEHAQLFSGKQQEMRHQELAKLQLEKLGLNDQFITQVQRLLQKETRRTYSIDDVKEMIQRYEELTKGFVLPTESSKKRTKAVYGMLKSQREKTLQAARTIRGDSPDLSTLSLGEINLAEYLQAQRQLEQGTYDEEQFGAYTVQRCLNLFSSEVSFVEGELDKFQSTSGKGRVRLNGYIDKSQESSNARRVGGVCVSQDNPSAEKSESLWNKENYLQLVLQDPEGLRCAGLVLLHDITEDGQKVLTASLNPSSTYLYSVDEVALFAGIRQALIEFAQDNNFDRIAVSRNRAIRTNRTGGAFENTMDKTIAKTSHHWEFSQPQTFSYSPAYSMKEMDSIWERTPKKDE